ncbi:class B sortase [Brotaphodocola sp.]|uniref:class B sortase n=1 Tax=Brotaphodocola sp. TaxID=3073577 RepID=UPI003D7ED34B
MKEREHAGGRIGILICAVVFLISSVEWGRTRMQAVREADTIAQLAELTRQETGTVTQSRFLPWADLEEGQKKGTSEQEMPDQNMQKKNLLEQERDHATRDYAKLSDLNSDFAGWLWIPGTAVDLPVMNDPGDPQKYLRKDFFGKSSAGGSLFFAQGCGAESDCLLIYGHNMRNGTMFGSLRRYEKKEYWENHRQIHFYMPEVSCSYEVFAVFRTTVSESEMVSETEMATGANADGRGENFPYYRYAGNLDQEAFQNLIREIRGHACYDTGIVPEYGDQILMLSTCSYHAKNGRFVVVARKGYCSEVGTFGTESAVR